MKHICVVTSAHPYDDTRVASRIATTFLDGGYKVTWVGPDRTLSANEDVKLRDVDYLLFSTGPGRLNRLRGAARAAKVARQVRDVDWWYSPDPDMAAGLSRLTRKFGGRSLFDIHESYHGGLLDRWFPGVTPGFVRELMRRRIARICSQTDLVMGVSERILGPYCDEHSNTVVIRNLAPSWFSDEAERRVSMAPQGRLRVMHGKISGGNGTDQVGAALSILSVEDRERISVVMMDVQSTPETARRRVNQVATDTGAVEILPGVPHGQMKGLMTGCAVGIISYQRNLGYESLPQRLFEYMAAGLAILAPSYSPEIVKILEAEQIGLVADFEDPGDIARAFNWLIDNPSKVSEMGERANRAYMERYTWDHESRKLLEALRKFE